MNLTSLTIKETADLLAEGKVTALEITEAYLARIDALNPKLNAYITVFHDQARAAAKASDERRQKGETLGILDGIPLAIKDNISIHGERVTAASKILENNLGLYDATVIKKLKAAGAVFLGKTNMDEFAMGSSTETSAYGNTLNPWDTDRVPGGSSGGSAVAVAADLCAGALGSDTFGSIRQPSGFCSIVGLKPTYGAVSRYGLLAMASSLDVIGPMTKSVEDARIILEIIEGQDAHDATTIARPTKTAPASIQGLKIGVPKELFGEGMNPANEKVVRDAIEQLKSLGAEIVEVSLPNIGLSVAAYYVLCPVEVASNMARYDGIRFGQSTERDGGSQNLLSVYEESRASYIGTEVKRRIMLGTYASSAGYYDAYYNQAMKVRAIIKQEIETVLTQVDCLVTPLSPSVAFRFGEKVNDPLAMYLEDVDTGPVNLAGVPAIAVPCGFVEAEGRQLPVGLQLIGAQLDEATILAVAEHYEQATQWHKQKPSLEEV